MSLGIIAAVLSAMLQPLFPGLARRAAHPMTVNFWGMVLAGFIFAFVYFRPDYWPRFAEFWELIIITSILKVLYVWINLPLLAKHEFQVLYPLTRIAPLFILFGEMVWLGAKFSALQILGVVFVISGALIFGFDKKMDGLRAKVFGLIALMTFFYVIAILIDKKLIAHFSPAEVFSFGFTQLPLLAPILFLQRKEAFADLKSRNTLFFSGAMIGSYFLMVFAFQYLDAAVVTSLRNLSILFGVFLGAHLFDEGHKILRYLAAVLICGGAFLTIM